MFFDILTMFIIFIKLWKYFSYIIHYKLRQFTIVVFNYKAKEFSIVVVYNISNFLFEWKWCQLFPLKLCVIFADFQNVDFVLNFICFLYNLVLLLIGALWSSRWTSWCTTLNLFVNTWYWRYELLRSMIDLLLGNTSHYENVVGIKAKWITIWYL